MRVTTALNPFQCQGLFTGDKSLSYGAIRTMTIFLEALCLKTARNPFLHLPNVHREYFSMGLGSLESHVKKPTNQP